MFAAGRAFEQVRNSIGYPHLNVKIGATHGGISVGEDGASHQCCEDFALMRSIPGMTVHLPCRRRGGQALPSRLPMSTKAPSTCASAAWPCQCSMMKLPIKFEIGKGEQLTEGSDVAIIATGLDSERGPHCRRAADRTRASRPG